MASAAESFLKIPPFPGATVRTFPTAGGPVGPVDRDAVVDALRTHRAIGNYWVPTELPANGVVLCRSDRLSDVAKAVAAKLGTSVERRPAPIRHADGDLWSLVEPCAALVCEEGDPARLVAALLDRPIYINGADQPDRNGFASLDTMLSDCPALLDPFDDQPLDLLDAIALSGFWRRLIETNRGLVGGLGFAFWKQETVAPLLWDGGDPLPFWRTLPRQLPEGTVAVWRSKASPAALYALERAGSPLIEVEDGFLRSKGLGADCIPPLSIIADPLGVYFSPARPSELERLLIEGAFDSDLCRRAAELRDTIVSSGLGKYGRSDESLNRPGGACRHVLVPGQVEDDRSVLEGGGKVRSNLDLLRRVRALEPDAFILYKPHPDVLAGHRTGDVAEREAMALADAIVGNDPIAPLLEMVDAVHVNTSLAGFEALMRGKPVTTHGVPFYAGWGLTTDLGDVPVRRNVMRSIDELVAATLLVYPRYLDPRSRLPSPAEVVVRRLSEVTPPDVGLVVRLRRWQGALMRQWRKLVG